MRDANLMTPAELRKLAEEKEASDKPCKMGFLKHDMYGCVKGFNLNQYAQKIHTTEELNVIIEEFKQSFEKVGEKGLKFVCYNYDDEYLWYDEGDGWFADLDDEWAKENLENIVDI